MTFQFDEDVTGPLYFYYGLENYYQNHRRYYKSLSRTQLQGQVSITAPFSTIHSDVISYDMMMIYAYV